MSEKSARLYRSRLPRTYRKTGDCRFGEIIPVLNRFVLPGDIWRISSGCLLRYQPMQSPPFNKANALFRFFFVPLRLVEPNFEKVITGSLDGKLLSESDIPKLPKMFDDVPSSYTGDLEVVKYSLEDYLSYPVMKYRTADYDLTQNKSLPARFWRVAYNRIYWDWYRDENLFSMSGYVSASNPSFDDWNRLVCSYVGRSFSTSIIENGILFANGNKDYFMSALPWQLKGETPTIEIEEVQGNLDFSAAFPASSSGSDNTYSGVVDEGYWLGARDGKFVQETTYGENPAYFHKNMSDSPLKAALESGKYSIPSVSFNAAQFRDMFAQTRVYEQLARTGSRYVEFLKGFFGTSPKDETLQRSVYLGGYKQQIITTEIVQTAGAVNTSSEQLPVGTLRGHGISSGQGRISFVAKEFGMIFGLMCVRPDQIYSQGVDKEYTYTDRFDFFNPAFQHLSEQEVRKGEIFFGTDTNSDGSYVNDDVFGFQPYAEELRRGRNQVVGDLRSGLAYWSQSIQFSSRPNLNQAFISTKSHLASFNKPFVVSSVSARPVLFDYVADCEIFRPMVKDGIPGLIDHI